MAVSSEIPGILAVRDFAREIMLQPTEVGCAKDKNWLLFDPNQLERFAHQKGGIIKNGRGKVLVTGLNDFDFFIGKWRVHHRRLKERLAHNDDWEQFEGTSTVQKILGGLGNMDDNVIELPSGTYRAATIRTYDSAKQTWTIWWIDSRNPGQLDPPVAGRFEKGVGTFYADDQFKGKPIRVRYLWNALTAPHWEQAFSADGGKTWETNWEMDFTRMQ